LIFTSAPYETPLKPDLRIESATEAVHQAVERVLATLRAEGLLNLLGKPSPGDGTS
jgi:adenylylsulfate kinase-like enzyme